MIKRLKFDLSVLQFLQYFLLGTWILSLAAYGLNTLNFSGRQIGEIYGAYGIASIVMPGLIGWLADRWQKPLLIYAMLHLCSAIAFVIIAKQTEFSVFYGMIMAICLFYCPSISLSNAICYELMEENGLMIKEHFPSIRIWGTIGFVFGTWVTGFAGYALTHQQYYVAAISALALMIFCWQVKRWFSASRAIKQATPPVRWQDFVNVFSSPRLLIFMFFAMLIGAALHTNSTFAFAFLHDFHREAIYSGSFVVNYTALFMAMSQGFEVVFIMVTPWVINKLGIKVAMALGFAGWALRFALFAIGNPGTGFVFLVLSMLAYGIAFMATIIGSIYLDSQVPRSQRNSVQGVYIMIGGFGSYLGAKLSGIVVDYYSYWQDGVRWREWPDIWGVLALAMIFICVLWLLVFRNRTASVSA